MPVKDAIASASTTRVAASARRGTGRPPCTVKNSEAAESRAPAIACRRRPSGLGSASPRPPRSCLLHRLDLLEHSRAPLRLELLGHFSQYRLAKRVDVRRDHRHAGSLELI